jgi:outer membrane protein
MKTVYSISALARVSNVFAVLGMTAALLLATPVLAAEAKDATGGKIAVVDLQYLVANSKAGKSIRNQLDGQRKTYGAQIEKEEAALRAAEKDLMAKREKMSKEELQKQGKAFQEKVGAAQKKVQQRRIAFDKAYTDAMEKLREHIVKIVADMAGKQNISLVLNRQEVVLVDSKMDITKQVMAALDAKVTSIPVNVK